MKHIIMAAALLLGTLSVKAQSSATFINTNSGCYGAQTNFALILQDATCPGGFFYVYMGTYSSGTPPTTFTLGSGALSSYMPGAYNIIGGRIVTIPDEVGEPVTSCGPTGLIPSIGAGPGGCQYNLDWVNHGATADILFR